MGTATGSTGDSRGERDGGLEARGESETDGADQRQGARDQSHQAEVDVALAAAVLLHQLLTLLTAPVAVAFDVELAELTWLESERGLQVLQ